MRHTEPHSSYRDRAARELPAAALVLALMSAPATGAELEIEVHGIKDPLLSNVRSRVDSFAVRGDVRLSERRLKRIAENVVRETDRAVRPFGFYHAEIRTELIATSEDAWRLDVRVERGPPMIVGDVTVAVQGAGADLPELVEWRKEWPLTAGKRLNQNVWEERKRSAMDLAEAHGYLSAAFTEHRIELDLERNEARLALVLETGPRAVLGTVRYEQDAVRPGVLANLPRFEEGQPYDAWLLERLRLDLWQVGYFDEIDIVEQRRLEENPPRVDLVVTARTRNRNTYQGSIGFGTDTGVRAQVLWRRHLLSPRGDNLETGLGWQDTNNEFSFRTSYKLPRRARAREFWTADFFVRRENQDLEVKADEDDAEFIKLANGDVTDYSIKAGRLIVRDRAGGYQQLFENWYVQFALENNTFGRSDVILLPPGDPQAGRKIEEFDELDSSLAVGINWDWPVIRGSAFETVGHHERAWIFTAQKAWGSEKEFTQAYVSTNWHRLLGSRFKLLLRGEVGYSHADVDKLQLDIDGEPLDLSVTTLPNIYRFKAGGSRSVRGYDFEALNNNGLGSNNILTASAELEMKFLKDWSVAAFYDVGNAFNSWSDVELKRGAGVGIRWYSIAGAIRLDFAQALDFTGNPWRIHFTIGTPLL